MKYLLLCCFCFFETYFVSAQTKNGRLDILRNNGILLENGWKYHAGDNPDWARPDFDDSDWEAIDPTQNIKDIPQIAPDTTGWLRLKLRLDNALLKVPLVLEIRESIASELYINGQFVPHYEQTESNFQNRSGYDPLGYPIVVNFRKTSEQVIAVRFRVPRYIAPFKYWWRIYSLLQIQVNPYKITEFNPLFREIIPFRTGIMLVLFFIHLAFFYFHKQQRANLYFSLYALSAFTANALFLVLLSYLTNVEVASFLNLPAFLAFPLSFIFLILALYQLFEKQKGIQFVLVTIFILAGLLSYFVKYEWSHDWNMFWSPLVVGIEAVRVAYQAFKNNKRAAKIVLAGAIAYFLAAFFLFPLVRIRPSGVWFHFFYTIEALSLLLAVSCYLAFEFAFTNRHLIQTLREVRQLSEEKERTLLQRNAELLAAILEGQITERKRVAADLHDNLSSTLTAIRWNLIAFTKQNISESGRKAYDELLSMTTSAHDQVRLISHNLFPAELEREGLICALQQLTRKINNSGKIFFELRVNNVPDRMERKMEFELYSIILELTQNIIKHSEASTAIISLRGNGNGIYLSVTDDGKGLAQNRQNGMGIQNIASRVRSLNGSWHINSDIGKGVVFEAEFT